MKLLLDTHTLIWFLNGDSSLSKVGTKEILKSSNLKFVSIATIWEMAIKTSLGKLKIHCPFKKICEQIELSGFEILPVLFEHTLLVSQLEFFHRDPFDRLLIAQAISENMTIVSKDEHFQKYPVNVIF